MPIRPPDEHDPALDHLLGALRAPATADELRGEQAMAAAMAAEYRQAAPKQKKRLRPLVVSIVAAVSVLLAGGTAVAARTGLLSKPAATQTPAPTPTTAPIPPIPLAPPPSHAPTPARSAPPRADWCAAWLTAAAGGKPMNGRDRRDLEAAAGGEASVAAYCGAATPAETAKPGRPAKSKKPKKPKKSKDVSP
ncbi:hypothetical protein [Paractinoplanes atraurantiacus]|uniref:Uncharacterized protein n=1 Tax=Paractinoplanes atraurantiacus TaxID=1036182 RepID=A0A285HY21_9ACTN|nr:hypothetical protein [Actinoplanes atraurantiacus]SNY40537.1 hypothetical protein SAMN05421748_10647 [Actinoplanes atraurantiacus]